MRVIRLIDWIIPSLLHGMCHRLILATVEISIYWII